MADKKPLKLSDTYACAQQFESSDTVPPANIRNGIPTGGTTGQVLSKVNGTDYNTQWTTPSGGGGGVATVTGPGVDNTDAADPVVNARPYKVYTALLRQTGTSAPVATVLEDTLGGTVGWTYEDVGEYSAILTGAFTLGKTWIIIGTSNDSDIYGHYHVTANSIGVTSGTGDGSLLCTD